MRTIFCVFLAGGVMPACWSRAPVTDDTETETGSAAANDTGEGADGWTSDSATAPGVGDACDSGRECRGDLLFECLDGRWSAHDCSDKDGCVAYPNIFEGQPVCGTAALCYMVPLEIDDGDDRCVYDLNWDDGLWATIYPRYCSAILFQVEIGDEERFISHSRGCANGQGWRLVSGADPSRETLLEDCSQFELCEEICDAIASGEAEDLAFVYGCEA